VSTRAATVSPVLHALLTGVVDYAGLFPPAALSMSAAAAEYAAHRSSPFGWMLGRFVAPVARLDELASAYANLADAGQGAWPLSVLVSADPAGDSEAIRAFNARHGDRLTIESVESRAATVEAINWALPLLDDSLERYVEIPLNAPRSLLAALARHGGRAKARTGGVTADAFPPAPEVARFILGCAELDLPFKATAGLHHPLRGEQRLTYESDSPSATMFGFLGVFGAAALARRGADEAMLVKVLEERDPDALAFEGDTMRWRDHTIDIGSVSAARHELALSFGSCSFREPVEDLRRLGLL
jgi:hypothetical protein